MSLWEEVLSKRSNAWGETAFKELIGAKILKVAMSQDLLMFEAARGIETKEIFYTVDGDCCSHSYFYDFYGPDKLIQNGVILEVNEVDLATGTDDRGNPVDANGRAGEVVRVYGYEFVSEHKFYGDQTAVVSFRNDSNGYYGGNLGKVFTREEIMGMSWYASRIDRLTDISNREWFVAND